MRNGRCVLVLHDESKGDNPPVSVDSFQAFKSKPFDELYEIIITPPYRMDRSYRVIVEVPQTLITGTLNQ